MAEKITKSLSDKFLIYFAISFFKPIIAMIIANIFNSGALQYYNSFFYIVLFFTIVEVVLLLAAPNKKEKSFLGLVVIFLVNLIFSIFMLSIQVP